MADGDETEALFRRYRREAVLLHRPWPPHAAPRTNSHLGGLPRLPEDYAWPRTRRGTPLYFLAQIDCADISFKTALPERGVLFFFAQDETDAWMAASPATDHCRVLYALDASALTPPRRPPADLPPFRYRPRRGNVHAAWPVVPLRFDSFPDESALPATHARDERAGRSLLDRFRRGVRGASNAPEIGRDVRDAYAARLDARRAAALAAATGAQPPHVPRYGWEAQEGGGAIFGFATSGPQSFPHHWACVYHLAREIQDRPREPLVSDEEHGARVAEAERWLGRSDEGPLDRPVAEDDRQALRAWLARLADREQRVYWSAVRTIWSWASDPALAVRIPGHVYDACAPFFYGYDEQYLQFSQMLGHTPAPHGNRLVDDPTICLLNLDTDLALGWDFGQRGQCTLWISPGDLARRDFSKVEGRLDGDVP